MIVIYQFFTSLKENIDQSTFTNSRKLAPKLEQAVSILILNNTGVSYLSGHLSPFLEKQKQTNKNVWFNRGRNLSFRPSPAICRMTFVFQASCDGGIWTRISNILQLYKSGILSCSHYLNPHKMSLYYGKHLIQIPWMNKLRNPHSKISVPERRGQLTH